jgi:hypothetical protein
MAWPALYGRRQVELQAVVNPVMEGQEERAALTFPLNRERLALIRHQMAGGLLSICREAPSGSFAEILSGHHPPLAPEASVQPIETSSSLQPLLPPVSPTTGSD